MGIAKKMGTMQLQRSIIKMSASKKPHVLKHSIFLSQHYFLLPILSLGVAPPLLIYIFIIEKVYMSDILSCGRTI